MKRIIKIFTWGSCWFSKLITWIMCTDLKTADILWMKLDKLLIRERGRLQPFRSIAAGIYSKVVQPCK